MLRITSSPTSTGTSLVLEGTVAGPWVEVLRSAIDTCQGTTELDLSEVHYVDADGVALLRSLVGTVTVRSASAYIAGLLGYGKRGAPR